MSWNHALDIDTIIKKCSQIQHTAAIASVVRSYEYFGHDAVVRVQPEIAGLGELVVRITGAEPLVPGARVGVSVHGPVVVWPLDDQRPVSAPWEAERERITHA